jgi:hypothetical protein
MRPKLKISNLISLQDARSSAAVGFDMISFNLERGNSRKLSASMIWNMVNWLSGPEIVLEMNAASLEELEEVKKLFPWAYITLPAGDWNELVWQYSDKVMLRADEFVSPQAIQRWVDAAADEGKELKVILSLPDLSATRNYEAVKSHVLLHFPSLALLETFIKEGSFVPFGFSLDQEAEEEAGVLDYERIDDLMEVFQERF